MRRKDISIGQSFWRFDINRRVYRKDQSRPVYAEHYEEWRVRSIFPRSVLLARFKDGQLLDVVQSVGITKLGTRAWVTTEEKDAEVWFHEQADRVFVWFRQLPKATIKQIAEQYGYTP